MSRYPVTNAQYRAFLECSDGYGDDRWWEGLDAAERGPDDPGWSESNHPRERVSWYESTAFCRWLSGKMGRRVELPTEEQWERVARGREGWAYPWGEEYLSGYANVDEIREKVGPHRLGRTSAVGIYPSGAAPEGVMDLSGNVWEWCQDEHEGKGSRVLRGGSWADYPQDARADYRLHYHPDARNFIIGFRVVCSSPIFRRSPAR